MHTVVQYAVPKRVRHFPALARHWWGMALALTVLAPSAAQAAWPDDQPIHLIVPFTAGGTADTLARSLAQQLSIRLHQNVIVENKAGAGSMLGTRSVAIAKPDGYTLLLGTTANVLNKYFYKNPLYDLQKDLQPINQMVEIPNFLAVNKNLPIHSIPELIAYAKAHPNKLSCAHSGVGASPFVSCEVFKNMADVKIVSVSYKGGTQAIADTIGGMTSLVFQSEALSYIRSNQLRPLGVTTASRSSYLKNVPAIGEVVKGYEVSAWYGLLGPAQLPPEITQKLSSEVTDIMKTPEMRERVALIGAEVVGSTPEAFRKKLDADIAYYDKVIPTLGLSAE